MHARNASIVCALQRWLKIILHFKQKQNCVIAQLKCKSIFYISLIRPFDSPARMFVHESGGICSVARKRKIMRIFSTEIVNTLRNGISQCWHAFYMSFESYLEPLQRRLAKFRSPAPVAIDATHYVQVHIFFHSSIENLYIYVQYTGRQQTLAKPKHGTQPKEKQYSHARTSCHCRLSWTAQSLSFPTCEMFIHNLRETKKIYRVQHSTKPTQWTYVRIQYIFSGMCWCRAVLVSCLVSLWEFPSLFSLMWIVKAENCTL